MTSTEPEQGSGENNIIEAVEMLTHGQGLAFQLRDLLLDDDDQIHVSGERLMLAEDLLDKIHGSFTNTISALDRRHSAGSSDQMAESGESSRRRPRSAPASRRRRREINESQSRTEISSTLVHDGHAWRKYGQKHILDAKHSRNYYKCTYKDQFGCPAKKHVQQIEDDPLTYRTVYTFSHTCTNMISNTTLDAPPASRMVLASTSAAQPADMNQPSSSTTMILNFQSNQHNSDDHNNNYNNNTLMKQEYPTLNDQLATEDHNIPSVVQQQMIPSNNNNLGCSSDVGGEVLHNMEDFMYYPPDTEDSLFTFCISQDNPTNITNAKKSKVAMDLQEEDGKSSRAVMFGDEYSNLLDQYERTLFLVDLDKAILSCSLSEPANTFPYHDFDYKTEEPAAPVAVTKPVDQGTKEQRVLSIHKALKKLARPAIFKHKKKSRKWHKQGEGHKGHFGCKPFSKSLGY